MPLPPPTNAVCQWAAGGAPGGAAGGDLGGNYPNPTLAASIGTATEFTNLGNVISTSGYMYVGRFGDGANALLYLDGDAGFYRATVMRTSNWRWLAGAETTGETGSDVGSDYVIMRYSDAGVYIDTPFKITRSSGTTTFVTTVQISSAAANAQFVLNANAGVSRMIIGRSAGAYRWITYIANSTAEGGGNAGSDWALAAYSDAGLYLSMPFIVTRSSGRVTMYDAMMSGTTPRFSIYETDGALDNKWWDIVADGEQLKFRLVNDADGVQSTFFLVDRTGTTINDIQVTVDAANYFKIIGGGLQFGAPQAIGAETVTHYIPIKDAAGNARKLAVVS